MDLLDNFLCNKSNLPNKFSIALGELVQSARSEIKLSQKELADLVYINQAAVSLIEKGKRSVSAEEIFYISIALNKPISYFFSMGFLHQIDENKLSVIEQELLINARCLTQSDLKKIIAQIKAINSM